MSELCRHAAQPIGFHVIMRLEDDRPIAATAAELRVVSRVVLVQGECRGLLAFGTADNHLHALLATGRASAGAFALYVATALRQRLGLNAPFAPARIRALQDQRHAYNTFHYVQRQDARHGSHRDPHREGTSLPDLTKLRVLETSIAERVRRHLPRIHSEVLRAQFPAGVFEQVRPIELDGLADAACAALAIADLHGRSPSAWSARRAAIHVAGPDVADAVLGDCLALKPRVVRALRALPAEPVVVRAVRGQALLRTPVKHLTDVA